MDLRLPPPAWALLLGWLLIGRARSEGACLQDGAHKATPSAEPQLGECSLYADNSCCSAADVQELQPANQNQDWDQCGPLSSQCEGFLKRVWCFYRCSPDAARWLHPHQSSALWAVPLCHSFCRDWFDACRSDLTCARNWARDPRGQNCTGSCVQYQQMYQHGRDLCESLWGDAFLTVEDGPQEEEEEEEAGRAGTGAGKGSPARRCLSLAPSDRKVVAALQAQRDQPEEPDSTEAGPPDRRRTLNRAGPGRRANSVVQKRSLVVVDDVEGSGSGL